MDTPPNNPHFLNKLQDCAAELAQVGVGALGDLYDLTAPRLLRYAQMLTGNLQDAEDALQAAMIRIALKPRLLNQAQAQWGYLLKIVRNEVFGIMEKKKRRRPLPLPEQLSREAVELSEFLEADDRRETIQQALTRLPVEQSEVVLLKIWEDMTFAEISDVLGESPNTVASRYRYALEKLTQSLKSYSDEVLHD